MNDKHHINKYFKWLIASLIILIILAISYNVYIYIFNHTARIYNSGEVSSDFTIKIAPRTGQTDSWPKIVDQDGVNVDYKGRIYDVTLNNIGDYDVSVWKLRIDITKPCYLNNAWCGTFEIHQKSDYGYIVQTIDLRDYNIDDISLDYKIADPDLLIPLQPGDFIIYNPDSVADEFPISAGSSTKVTQVVIGVILYDNYEQPLDFSSYQLEYYLQKHLFQSWLFSAWCIGFGIWCILFISYIATRISMQKAHLRFVEDEHIIKQSIGVFTRFFEAKDIYTRGHSQRVATISRLISEKLDFSEDQCRQFYYIALMHDCGKCYIPDEILKKPGKLTDEEYEIIKSHTVKGAEMLVDFTSIDSIRDGVLYHHERYDGKGYPEGLKGTEIPLISRIICVADSFDAMNSKRCYRDMLSKEYILNEFESNSGKQFDPDVTKAFLELVKEGKIEFTEATV